MKNFLQEHYDEKLLIWGEIDKFMVVLGHLNHIFTVQFLLSLRFFSKFFHDFIKLR